MKGKKKFIAFVICFFIFLFSFVVGANSDMITNFFNYFTVTSEGNLKTQGAGVLGAFSIEGFVQTTEGIVNASGTVVAAIDKEDGGLCIGDCGTGQTQNEGGGSAEEGNESVSGEDSFEESTSTATTTATSTSNTLATTTATSTEQESSGGSSGSGGGGSGSGSSSGSASGSTTTATSTAISTESTASSTATNTTQTASSTSETATSTATTTATTTESTASSTAATTTVATSTATSTEELSPIDVFIEALEKIMFVVNGKVGIGNPLPKFALSIKGFLQTTKGILIGSTGEVGFGETQNGSICLGFCEFVESANSDTNTETENSTTTATTTSSFVASSTVATTTPEVATSTASTTVSVATTSTSTASTTPEVATSTATTTAVIVKENERT